VLPVIIRPDAFEIVVEGIHGDFVVFFTNEGGIFLELFCLLVQLLAGWIMVLVTHNV
jgi:hypothetical protein